MFFVYMLYSASFKKIYIGFTSDLEERLRSHNELSKKGWTIKFRPWQIVYTESYDEKNKAMAREQQLKSAAGRQFVWLKVAEFLLQPG